MCYFILQQLRIGQRLQNVKRHNRNEKQAVLMLTEIVTSAALIMYFMYTPLIKSFSYTAMILNI